MHRDIKTYKLVNWIIVISAVLLATNSFAAKSLPARIEIGLNMLPSVIASNTVFSLSENEINKPVTIYVVYRDDESVASESTLKLQRIKNIRGHQLVIKSISTDKLMQADTDLYTAMIITEPMIEDRDQLINFSRQRQILFFSPFKGDVEKGVMAGFKVTNKVLPAVNLTALNKANIRLKAFFLRIAVSHD